MEAIFFTYLRTSFLAGIMILAVLLVRPLLRKAPRNITCLLWLLVALRLLIPFELESPISLQPRPITESVSITELAPQPISPTPELIPEAQPDPVPQVQQPIMDAQPDPSLNIEPETVIAILWSAGSLGLLIYAAVSFAVLRHRVRDAVQCPDGVWESDRIADAFLLGYWKPRIYLPAILPHRDRALIVAHERSHQSRGDQWWKLLGLVCLSVHWFNPLVWLGFWLMCRDIEAACDEKVIHNLDLEQRKDYSMALLNSGKRMSGFLSYPVSFGEVNLQHRIKSVLSYRKPGLWITLGAITLAAVIAVCFMTNPKNPEPDTLQTPPVADTQPEATVPTENPTKPTAETTEPTTITTEQVTIPTEPVTEATTAPTEPVTEATTAPTKPVTEPTVSTTTPTEPTVQTKPQPTEPKPTETSPTGPQVIAEDKWLGRTHWSITSDGVLTLTGTRHIDGASYVDYYPWMQYKKQITKIVISEGITKLPSHIFQGMTRVTEVSLPSTVEKIDTEAFRECSSLKSITIPAKVQTLEHGVFFLCTSLHSIDFADGSLLETIKTGALADTALVEFHGPTSLKAIEEEAFSGCTSLKVLDLWNANASVHHNAFNECSGIKQVFLGKGSYILQYTYPNWHQVETAKLYSDFYELFSKRSQLQSVEIGGRVTEIPFNAFRDCTALSEVTITAPITSVEMNAFMNCSSLTELTLPDTVTEILHYSLSGTGIKTFTVPASVKKLSQGVFKDSALEQIIFLGDAPKISDVAFEGIHVTAYYPADNETWTNDKLKNYGGGITWVPIL